MVRDLKGGVLSCQGSKFSLLRGADWSCVYLSYVVARADRVFLLLRVAKWS
jgi:hypothetical protein